MPGENDRKTNKLPTERKLNKTMVVTSKVKLIVTASEIPVGSAIRELRRASIVKTFACHVAKAITIKIIP